MKIRKCGVPVRDLEKDPTCKKPLLILSLKYVSTTQKTKYKGIKNTRI
jgi:hypothetical protein